MSGAREQAVLNMIFLFHLPFIVLYPGAPLPYLSAKSKKGQEHITDSGF